jgi:acyl carrier protein
MYGPTEGTCGATIKRLKAGQSVTIGNPNPSSRIYILDSCQRMLPRGVIGEIYLAGVQISNGYIGRPRETATCFMTDSIFPDLEERMYRTGDRGYWNADGELVYLGRNDRRIKLRGFRLDLDDIETRILETILSASTIAVTAVGETIVAMLEPSSLDLALVRSLLGKALPPYAIPQRLAAVEKIPLTPTGKIDYKAIEKFAFPPRMPVNEQYMTQSEQTVASIWRSILNLSIDVKVHGMSSFLDLGGNSIQILLLSHRLSAQFGRPVSMKMVLESNTLADLARAIETIHLTEKICTETQKSILGAHNLSSIEYEWWLKYDLGRGSSCFNVSYACSFTDAVERSRLALAWNTILARHEILRGKFVGNKKDGVKREYTNHPPRVQRLRRIDFRKEVNTPFILHRQHPIRVLMSSKELLVIVSHIICDMTTIKILLKEVGLVYLGGTLEPVGKKYGDTIGWNFKLPSTTLEFWSKYLEDLPSLKYDVGKCSLQRKGYGGSSLAYIVPPAISRTMAKFSAASKISLHQLSLAAVSLALTYTSEQQDVILGAPFLNRTSSDDLETVGLFLEPLPVRIQYPCRNSTLLSDNSQLSIDVDPFLLEIRSSSRAALAHEIPWNRLCEHLNIEPEYPNHPIFDVMVTFHEYETKPLLQLPHLTPLYTWAEGAKFKLMVEFQAISQDCLILRLEHDEDCFSMEDIEVFQKLVMLALDLLASGRRHEEVKKHLLKLAVSLPRPHAVKDSQNLFAMPIESLK